MTHREKDGEKGRREAQKEFLCVGMCGCVSLSFAPHLRFRVQQLSFDCQQTPLSLSLLREALITGKNPHRFRCNHVISPCQNSLRAIRREESRLTSVVFLDLRASTHTQQPVKFATVV
jgi:hypothetical protein